MNRFLLFLLLFSSTYIFAKEGDKIHQQALIQVELSNSYMDYLAGLFPKTNISLSSEMFQIWKVEFQDSIPLTYIRSLILRGKIKNYVQNRRLVPRITKPNDTFFSQQWHHLNDFNPGQNVTTGMNSIGAWDFDKGYTTAKGDTIVVAVCDFGFDTMHEDLDYFTNRNEIPHDGIDNDGNGAIDDYRGWNVGYNNNHLAGSNPSHGMAVCGGIAAKGNNSKGVAGVAWNCKLLPLNKIDSIEYSIQAFEYIIKMKRLYYSSNKQKGAYIVAINYSLGTEGFLPEDEPLWCAIFDSLGKVGILSINAASDVDGNSESLKDMPILCNSPYMINVTTYNRISLGLNGRAYSNKYVHLAAMGQYFTTRTNNQYGLQSAEGTSFAAPLVTGAVALIYSNFKINFLDSIANYPELAVLKIKNSIIKGVDTTDLLTGKVVSNGKLNLYKSIILARKLGVATPTVGIQEVNDNTLLYSYNKSIVIKKRNLKPLYFNLYNLMGQMVMSKIIDQSDEILDASALSEGIYIATYYQNETIFTTKIELR